ncbi:MAG: BatA and WFA domain-containing protein [bacterium]
MVFLNPAVLFGFLAASIPIIIHLLNLRKLKKIEFSTLAFLKELQKNKIKKVKIKQWILLALRTLIIIFLVFSFSRPTIKSTSVGGTNSAAKTTAVIIIDNTFSMSVITDKGSYLNRAKKIALNLLSKLQEGDEAVIIAAGSVNSNISLSTDLNKLKSQLNNLQLSYVSAPLHKSVIQAANIISKSDNFNKEIYILSDFQSKTLYEDKKGLSDFSKLLNQQVRLYSFDLSDKETANLSITELKSNNQIFEVGKNINFEAVVTNSGNLNITNSIISLFINGQRTAQQNVSLDVGQSKIINFDIRLKNGNLLEVFAELEDDEINADNKRYFTIFVPEKINLLILTDDINDGQFIKAALTKNDSVNSFVITEKSLNQISALNLNSFNTIIIIGSELINNYTQLNNYLSLGGNIILFPGPKSTLSKYKTLLENLSVPSFNEYKGSLANQKAGYNFGNIDYLHPLFTEMFSKGKTPVIQSPNIYYYFKLQTGSLGRNIIEMEDKSPFLLEYTLKSGKLLIYNTSPNLTWTDFPIKGIFAPILNRAVYYMSTKFNLTDNITAGTELFINLTNSFYPQVNIIKPENKSEIVAIDTLQDKRLLKYNNTETLGAYKFKSGNDLIGYSSVNTNPVESDLTYLNDSDFEDYLKTINFKGSYFKLNVNDNYIKSINQSRFGAELWRLFLIIALILAVIEMAVSKSSKKDLAKIG